MPRVATMAKEKKTAKAPKVILAGKDFAGETKDHGFKVEPTPNKRRTIFTEKLAVEFLNRVASGRSIQDVCEADDMPDHSTIARWAKENISFERELAHARELMADAIAAKALKVGTRHHDKDDVPGDRLEFDALRWYCSKVAPKRWGDKVEIEQKSVNININAEITDNDRVRALAGLLAKTKAEREP